MSRFSSALVNLACRVGAVEQMLAWRRGNPLILMYHGVTGTPVAEGLLQNSEEKHYSIDTFRQHLKTIKRWRRAIPLHEMVEGLRSGNDLQNTVAITFDDGYENNFLYAAPALADFNLPAAFFLSTAIIGTKQCMWTDRVEIMLDRTRANCVRLDPANKALPLYSLQDKRRALSTIKAAIKQLPHAQLAVRLDDIADQLKIREIEPDGDYKFMDWDQARSLAGAGFEIGAHTVNHPILSRIPFEEAKREILESRDKVKTELGQCSTTFCYPNGGPADYTSDVMNFCQQHFRAAISTSRGSANSSELYRLRRLGAPGARSVISHVEWFLLRER